MFVEIAVCLPLSRTFLYKLAEPAAVGCRVTVPFRGRAVEGFIVGFKKSVPEGIKPLDVAAVLDREPLLPTEVFGLCQWIARYYRAPLGECLRSALPPAITQKHVDKYAPNADGVDAASADHAEKSLRLTAAQNRVLQTIVAAEGFSTILLHGVTGSGKTEVYIQAAEHTVGRGRSCIILVPEIGLTPQLANRFTGRFPGQTAVLHSGLTRKQRIGEWLRIRSGRAPVVIGTRSAVFAPLVNLGLIVVDEEHETSYKQEETPRYHGRDVAIVRAKSADATIVLGSATPSMESFRNAESGKFTMARLDHRVEERPLPRVEVVNMRDEYLTAGKQVVFSSRLLSAIGDRLERREQTMVLLNRRGYAAFLLCRKCGFTYQCSSCSVSMTYHRSAQRLLCHYCGLAKRPPERCPDCKSEHVHYVGEGTERLESDLIELFPGARIARLDRDTMRKFTDFERVLGAFRAGDLDILVGTQMIAKGHDFPNVTLVGVLAADAALSLPDFRAAERTFQLLTQVAGRAGRGDRPGEVVVQSYHPEHYTFQLAVAQRFEDFYQRESRYRKALFYPPFTALAGIVVMDRNPERTASAARAVGQFLNGLKAENVRILGPAPAPLERIKQVHRHQLLIKATSRDALQRMLGELENYLEGKKLGSTRIHVDVDPVSLL